MVILLRARKSLRQPAHGLARVIGIKIVGLEAGQCLGRVFLCRRHLHLVVAVLENLQGEIIAGIVVIGFLDHLDAGAFSDVISSCAMASARSRSPTTSCRVQPPLAPTRRKIS